MSGCPSDVRRGDHGVGGSRFLLRGTLAGQRYGENDGYLCRQAEVSHGSLHHRRLFNERHEAQPPTAARTRRDIETRGA